MRRLKPTSGPTATIASLGDVFTVQDEITDAVANAIGPAISEAEQQRAMRKPPDNLDAWEAYQTGTVASGKVQHGRQYACGRVLSPRNRTG